MHNDQRTQSAGPGSLSSMVGKAVQGGVPFTHRPFAQMAQELGLEEHQVVDTLRELSTAGTLREISAIIEGQAVDHESALVAAKVPDARVEEVAAVISAHPTVTHNYLRDHAYNLWFTMAAPRAMGLQNCLELLARDAGLETWHPAPRTETYKIGVNIDLDTLQNSSAKREISPIAQHSLDKHGEAMVRALQTPLPIGEEPFAALAAQCGVDEEELLEFGRRHYAPEGGGLIRRYAGTLRHRKAGVRSNAMVVWAVPPEDQQRVGNILAAAPEVSHCYGRVAFPGFPYTLYSMVHAPNVQVAEEVIARLASACGVSDFRPLTSTREFKKQRLRYFLPAMEQWWHNRNARRAVS